MSDLEDRACAEKVRLAVRALNEALFAASKAGIQTHLRVEQMSHTGHEAPTEVLSVELSKTL